MKLAFRRTVNSTLWFDSQKDGIFQLLIENGLLERRDKAQS